MRVLRLSGVVLTLLIAGVLLATPAGAQPPSQLTNHITDNTGVLTDSGRAAVSSAIDRLYRDRRIQLWVVYVDNFSRFKPENWASRTRSASAMGDHDALLAVATNTKLYAFTGPHGLSAAQSHILQTDRIRPKVAARDWSGAAVAAADGLDESGRSTSPAGSSTRLGLPIAIGAIGVVVVAVLLFLLFRARRRAAGRVNTGGGQVSSEGHDRWLGQALSTADARVRQISDYVGRHRESVGAEALTRLEEAKRHLAAAHGKEANNETEAIAHANRASTLAAEAQTLANDNVLAAHRPRRRRGAAPMR